MCDLTPTIEATFRDREQHGPGAGRQERMDTILGHVASGECQDCIGEMRRVFDAYQADQAAGGSFPITYAYLGVTLLSMSFLFGLVGKSGVPVGSIPPILAMLGIGCLLLHAFVRRGA